MMPTRFPILRRTAFLLALAMLVSCLGGCFGRGNDPQEEPYDPEMDDTLILGTEDTTEFETEIELETEETTEPTEESTEPTEESTEPTEETEPEGLAGVITGDLLNIRSGPGTKYSICGSLKKNDQVLILEQKIEDDKLWGRIEEGWISMSYVLLEDPDQVLTVKETLKGISLEKLKLYEGPGSHYTSSGSLAKNSRVTILETCGKWGKTEKGWVDLEDVYIDGTEGPDDPIKGTVTGSLVNLRSDPSTTGAIEGTVKKNDRVEIFFQIKIGDMTWGCTKDGWICMDYVRLDDDAKEDILGSWYCYWDITETSKTVSYYSRTYTFKADGTYEFASYIIDIDKASGSGSYEVYASGSGNYTYDGGELVIGNRAYLAEVRGKELHLTESKDTYVYIPGDLEDSFEYAKNQHKPDANDPAIVGSWYSFYTESNGWYSYQLYTFNADGTYTSQSLQVEGSTGSYNISASSDGTYTFDGTTLILNGRSQQDQMKDGNLFILMGDGSSWKYIPGDMDDIIEEVLSKQEETVPTEPEPTETEPPALHSSIFGTWQDMVVCTYCDSGTCLTYGGYFTFNSDGTFTGLDHGGHYFYTPETGAVYDENSPGRGSQELRGTYTFDGSTLILTYTYIEWEDLSEPMIQTWQVSIRNGCLTMTSSYTRTLYKGNLDEAAALLFG